MFGSVMSLNEVALAVLQIDVCSQQRPVYYMYNTDITGCGVSVSVHAIPVYVPQERKDKTLAPNYAPCIENLYSCSNGYLTTVQCDIKTWATLCRLS